MIKDLKHSVYKPGGEISMDIGVIVALAGLGLTTLLVVLMGIVAGVSAVVGIGSPHEDE